ncbi:MAG: phosphoribosyltransferase domain-containing protein [Thiocapsa sp.]|uniref:phosphoribosyltransferase domain-containing protein n=1 Tax=Thiocapsa sp. TaxID=2024551 RepID=UPI001BD0F3FB|nr:phosphoribosyltransferase domain-containing protein [Thiocapsa sp.]QVL47741.1 MAG: phosphoribosyltransferase domain-containing protein [Thiocapsa sp.]
MDHIFPIPGGTLHIETTEERLPLERLLAFAARANPRRPYLFVSKVLGRHIPCAPARMRETYRLLVEDLLDLPGPVWTIAMAETATGLGGGIAETLARRWQREDVVFQHSTRAPLAMAPMLVFSEAHSHAPGHLLYPPAEPLRNRFRSARTLVIIDDELSTGATVENLLSGIIPLMPALSRLCMVNLVDWLASARRAQIADSAAAAAGRPLTVSWHALLTGSFAFVPEPGFHPGTLPGDVTPATTPAAPARGDLGRRGVLMPAEGLAVTRHGIGLPASETAASIAAIGVGECALPSFLHAESLAAAGYRVTVQCTSRSPVKPGGAIAGSLACEDPYQQGVGYYLHNPPGDRATWLVVGESGAGGPMDAHPRRLHRMTAAPLVPQGVLRT